MEGRAWKEEEGKEVRRWEGREKGEMIKMKGRAERGGEVSMSASRGHFLRSSAAPTYRPTRRRQYLPVLMSPTASNAGPYCRTTLST